MSYITSSVWGLAGLRQIVDVGVGFEMGLGLGLWGYEGGGRRHGSRRWWVLYQIFQGASGSCFSGFECMFVGGRDKVVSEAAGKGSPSVQ